ncbi:lipopolysaccharide transport system ATP-binding protein [Desulfacinum infernum DSM 9756]|uniref:Lipopolysaccharide transport system ATP-binding protein n=1 Tax=Desulfacinum infernum DSM 9756 TaxID=1121391 RepID=A0A1M4SWU5_9BACT|nr:ABC transporter ATP-binding protein [Desulfacinum infernum]SHE36497.1 lipopolysaccharide transport system ATP-binding protein [Desulfacinum infernum DSM 9756]
MSLLRVANLGKAFRSYRREWHRFARWAGLPMAPGEETWVLRHVSFEAHHGRAIGIIGQNGAGKSTLLKIITGTLHPTEGHVEVNGRIAAILELGMGFHPELTGRQNARHAAGLMGFTADEIEAAMPSIEEFAEIGEYFDEPLRTYSSGMQMRLAFSVATAWRPDILIVDEALSVGDSYFQHKSFDRIRKFKEEGTVLLFVSHGMQEVKELCDRVVLLDKGRVIKDGLPDEVVDYYNALIAEKQAAGATIRQQRTEKGWMQTRSGSGEARIASVKLLDAGTGVEVATARVGQKLCLVAEVEIRAPIPRLVMGYMLRDRVGHVVWGTNTWHTRQVVENLAPGDRVTYELHFTCSLGPGSYSFSTALHENNAHMESNYEWVDNVCVFDVINTDKHHFIGCNHLQKHIHINYIRNAG